MAQNSIFDMFTTPASNVDINGIGVIGSSLVSTADDAFRNLEALLRKSANDLGGLVTVGGTANAITVTSSAPNSYSALTTGLYFRFRPGSTNTAATTLNLDALGAKAVRKVINGADAALAAGDIVQGVPVFAMYLSTANGGAGAWIIVPTGNFYGVDSTAALPTYSFDQDTDTGFYRIGANEVGLSLGGALAWDYGQQQTTYSWADNGAATGPIFALDRNSASPAANDFVGFLQLSGRDSAAASITYGSISAKIVSPTSGAAEGNVTLATATASNGGLPVTYLTAGSGKVQIGTNAIPATLTATGPIDASAAASGQIIFPATQNPSANANTLDDYAEGATTLGVTFGGGNTGMTLSASTLTWVKVGKQFTGTVRITFTAKGSSTGAAVITGLPYVMNRTVTSNLGTAGNMTLTGAASGLIAGSSQSITLQQSSATGTTNLTDAAFSNTTDFTITISGVTAN